MFQTAGPKAGLSPGAQTAPVVILWPVSHKQHEKSFIHVKPCIKGDLFKGFSWLYCEAVIRDYILINTINITVSFLPCPARLFAIPGTTQPDEECDGRTCKQMEEEILCAATCVLHTS